MQDKTINDVKLNNDVTVMEKVKIEKYFISDIYFYQEGPGVRKWQFTTEGVKLINVGNINKGKIELSSTKIFLSEKEANAKYSHFLIDEGDLLIACSGIVVDNFHNKIAFIEKEHLPLCLNTSTMRFKELPKKKGSLIFLKYFLQTRLFKDQLSKLITGSAQLNFGPSHIRKIEIPLPPLPTQQKIAAILDKADELRQYNKQLIEKYEALTQSLFLDMFGDPVRNEKGWEIKNLKTGISKLQSGLSLSGEERQIKDDEIAVLKISAVTTGVFINTEYKVVDKAEIKKVLVYPKKGDLLFSRANTKEKVGAVAIVDKDYHNLFIPDKLWRIDTNNILNKIFLKFLLSHSGFRHNIEKVATGTSGSMVNISMSKLLEIEASFPPINLQNQFAERVKMIELQKQQALEALEKSEALFQGLLQQAFKGLLN
jgi:type I restriction enzyme S subunit